jgi:GNAT superfamily N-acetyltransferase
VSPLPAGYRFEADPRAWDRDAMHAFLSKTYWTPGLERAQMERSLDNSFGVAVFQGTRQAGFARVITDRTRFAYLCDVYVEAADRGRGLARAMVAWFHEHAELASVTRWLLITRDAAAVYEALGYGEVEDMNLFMQRKISR